MQSTQRLALQTIILYELSNHQRNKKDFVISGLSQNSIYLNSLESNSEHHEPFPRQVFGASFQPTIFPKKRGHLLSEAALSRMNCPTYHSKSRVWVWVEICSYSHQLGSNLAKKKIEAAHNCSTDSSTMSGVVPK